MDINSFGPFEAEVWGTFADYSMVVVTGYTLYYLRKTLRSQQEVQTLQHKLTRIENERYRREDMPSFNVQAVILVEAQDDEYCKQRLMLVFTLGGTKITDCKIDISATHADLTYENENCPIDSEISPGEVNALKYYITSSLSNYQKEGYTLEIRMKFTDPVGNEYKQDCSVTVRHDLLHINPGIPTYKYK